MAVKTFEHVLILADDVEKTKDFYVNILGLEVGYRPDFPFKGYWLYLKDNKTACIHLATRKYLLSGRTNSPAIALDIFCKKHIQQRIPKIAKLDSNGNKIWESFVGTGFLDIQDSEELENLDQSDTSFFAIDIDNNGFANCNFGAYF